MGWCVRECECVCVAVIFHKQIQKSVTFSFGPEQKKYTYTILCGAGLMLDFTILDVIFNLKHFMIPLPCTVLQRTK